MIETILKTPKSDTLCIRKFSIMILVKKNKIIVSKKNLYEKRNICDIILRNHKKKPEKCQTIHLVLLCHVFLHKINVIMFCRIHCYLEIHDEIKMMAVLHAFFVTLK